MLDVPFTANARGLATAQMDSVRVPYNIGRIGLANYAWPGGTEHGKDYLMADQGIDGIARGFETRPRNVVYHPRIHV